jgi:hypothetical protein
MDLTFPERYGSDFLPPGYAFFLDNSETDSQARLGFSTFPPPPELEECSAREFNPEAPEEKYPILNFVEARQESSDDFAIVSRDAVTIFRRISRVMEVYLFEDPHIVERFEKYASMFMACLLAEDNGLLLHGSGFILDGMSGAVIGPSGAGKSTAARLIDHDFLLSDDAVAVTGVGDKTPLLNATPFGGKTDGVGEAPLKALFFPRKSEQFAIRPITPREALVRYLNEHAEYISEPFKPYVKMTFENAHEMFQKVPSYELSFSKDYIDTDAIREVLGEGGDS